MLCRLLKDVLCIARLLRGRNRRFLNNRGPLLMCRRRFTSAIKMFYNLIVLVSIFFRIVFCLGRLRERFIFLSESFMSFERQGKIKYA